MREKDPTSHVTRTRKKLNIRSYPNERSIPPSQEIPESILPSYEGETGSLKEIFPIVATWGTWNQHGKVRNYIIYTMS